MTAREDRARERDERAHRQLGRAYMLADRLDLAPPLTRRIDEGTTARRARYTAERDEAVRQLLVVLWRLGYRLDDDERGDNAIVHDALVQHDADGPARASD